MEYVILIAVGVLFASLLYAAVSSDSVQQAIKNRVIQILTGELTELQPADDYPDKDGDQPNRPASPSPPASAPPAANGEESGLLDKIAEGLKDLRKLGGKMIDGFVQRCEGMKPCKDILENDIKRAWNDPAGYLSEVFGWEDIRYSWQKFRDDPWQYLADSWDNTVKGWNEFWEDPLYNGAKLIFDWELFSESVAGVDENGRHIPLPNRIWGIAESLPLPTKALKAVKVADNILVHEGCVKKGCSRNKIDLDPDTEKKVRDHLAKVQEKDPNAKDLIKYVDEKYLGKQYKALREKGYPEGKAFAVARNRAFGRAFNEKMKPKYPYNEVMLAKKTKKGGRLRVDSYDPDNEEIISRKYTQLSQISFKTAKAYIDEIPDKYESGTLIADVDSQRKGSGHPNAGLARTELEGKYILEIPFQKHPVPKEILDHATKNLVIIRDETGRVYNPEVLQYLD